jgi:hypothetical protein
MFETLTFPPSWNESGRFAVLKDVPMLTLLPRLIVCERSNFFGDHSLEDNGSGFGGANRSGGNAGCGLFTLKKSGPVSELPKKVEKPFPEFKGKGGRKGDRAGMSQDVCKRSLVFGDMTMSPIIFSRGWGPLPRRSPYRRLFEPEPDEPNP